MSRWRREAPPWVPAATARGLLSARVMRGWLSILPAALALLLAARPGAAAHLPFEGQLSLDWLAPALPTLWVTGTGVATLNGSQGGPHLLSARFAGGISGSTALPVTDPEVTGAGGFRAMQALVALGTGTLGFGVTASGAPQLTRPALPVGGFARLCFFDAQCLDGVSLPLSASSGAVGLGVGGLLTAGGSGSQQLFFRAEPWTVGTTLIPLTTNAGSSFAVPVAGWLHGPASFTTSTALSGGAFSVVTPLVIESGQGGSLAGFGRLELRFLPEPGALALWSAACAALLALARARWRERRP